MLVMRAGAPKLRIDELAFSPDGTGLFAPGLAAGFCHWPTLSSGAKSDMLSLPTKVVKRLAFAPNGTLYAGSDQLCAFDLGSKTGTFLDIPKWAGLWFGPSPDGKRLVVAENPQGSEGTRLTLWDLDALAAPVREVFSPLRAYSAPLFPSGGGRFIQMEGESAPDRRWEFRRITRSAETLEVVDRSDPLADDPDQMVLSPDGLTVACRTRNTIRIYPSTGSWKQVPVIANDGKQHFTGIAYHPSGKLLAATSNDKTVKLYDTASGRLAREYTWDIGRTRSVAFSPDGMLAAAGSDTGKVVVWDVDG